MRDTDSRAVALSSEMRPVRIDLCGEIAAVRRELLAKMDEMERIIVISMWATTCSTIAAISVMIAYVR